MSIFWNMIKSLVHAAEEMFTDPQSGPAKLEWVKDQLNKALDGIKMSGWIKNIVRALIPVLIEAAVSAMKNDV